MRHPFLDRVHCLIGGDSPLIGVFVLAGAFWWQRLGKQLLVRLRGAVYSFEVAVNLHW